MNIQPNNNPSFLENIYNGAYYGAARGAVFGVTLLAIEQSVEIGTWPYKGQQRALGLSPIDPFFKEDAS